jgi:putative SOS response-associated peptidase YedK
MLITEANGFVSEVHDRMPVILEPDQFEPWLFCEAGIETLKPAANDVLHRRPVSKRVNSSRTPDDDILINRIVTLGPAPTDAAISSSIHPNDASSC